MSHQVVTVRRDALAPCMTCPLCHRLLRDATTITECLHTFCRKCIYKKLSDEEMECCPICDIDLGCVPLEKLRPDHTLQDVRAKIFPYKRVNATDPEAETAVALPAKRKERSLSSLVVNTPRVSTQNGLTGRRSKSIARKASKGPKFIIEKPVKKEDYMDDYPDGSGLPETSNKFSQSTKQNYATGESSNCLSPDKGRDNGSGAWEGKVDLWKPLNCLVEAANRSKSSKFAIQESACKSDALHDNEVFSNKTKNEENRQKSRVQDEKNFKESTPPESARPKRLRRIHPKKPRKFGEFMVPPQVVLDATSARYECINYPVWFSLVSDEREGDIQPLPQIAASYLRIKDGNLPVSFIQKYLKKKLDLMSEDEVEIKYMGQTVIPTLTLNNLIDTWLQTTTTEKVSATVGSSAKDFVMVLGYARKAPTS